MPNYTTHYTAGYKAYYVDMSPARVRAAASTWRNAKEYGEWLDGYEAAAEGVNLDK